MKETYTLEIDTESESYQDDRRRFHAVLRVSDMQLAIHSYDQELRRLAKYEDDKNAEKYRKILWEFLNDYDVKLD